MSFGAYVAANTLGSLLSGAVDTLAGPGKTRLAYFTNENDSVVIPPPGALLSAVNAGLMRWEEIQSLLAKHGVRWHPDHDTAQRDIREFAWYAVQQSMRNVPSVETVLRGWQIGQFTWDEAERLIFRAGGDKEHWQWARHLGLAVPDPGTIHQAFTRGYIDFDEWKKLLIRSGARDFHWNAVLPAYEAVPSIAETLSLYNRRFIDDPTLDALLHRNGFADQNNRELIKNLRFAIPSISDLITMQVREAFNPDLANQLGLYDESPKDIVPYFEAQGLKWGVNQADRVTPLVGNVDGRDRPLEWPDMYWAMHWRPFSPEQVFRMWHVLRPERIQRYKARGLNVEPFQLIDVQRWLRIQDYPPKVRDYLAAIAFTPLRLVDIRAALTTGVAANQFAADNNLPAPANEAERADLSRKWAIQQYLDRGVHPSDAEVQADLALEQQRRRRLAAVTNLERASLARFLQNTIDDFKVGIINRLQAEAIFDSVDLPKPAQRLVLDNAEREVSRKIVQDTIKLIRQRFLEGQTDIAGARAELDRANIKAERGTQYLNLWTVQRNQRSRMVTTAKIQEWARMGLLSPQEAATRLDNLGWSQPDLLLHLAEIQSDVNQIQAREAQSQVKTARAQAKELERLIKANQQQAERMRAELRRLSPVSTLKKWLKLGIISEQFFGVRMSAMGYPPDEILRHMQEVFADAGEQSQTNGQAGPATEEETPSP